MPVTVTFDPAELLNALAKIAANSSVPVVTRDQLEEIFERDFKDLPLRFDGPLEERSRCDFVEAVIPRVRTASGQSRVRLWHRGLGFSGVDLAAEGTEELPGAVQTLAFTPRAKRRVGVFGVVPVPCRLPVSDSRSLWHSLSPWSEPQPPEAALRLKVTTENRKAIMTELVSASDDERLGFD